MLGNSGKQTLIANELAGRTKEQQTVIRYFTRVKPGCMGMGKLLSDQEYHSMVLSRARSVNVKKRALDKLGLDEDQVNEIEPVHFEGYHLDRDIRYVRRGDDGKWRTSAYQISWLFFSSTEVYLYKYTFHMDNDANIELTDEYFYRDITNFSNGVISEEREVPMEGGCGGSVQKRREIVTTNAFQIIVPGASLMCPMEQNSYTDNSIKGMRAKLREKKEI